MAERAERAGEEAFEGRKGPEGREAIAVFDETGVVVVWAPAAERLLGVDRAGILGRP
ncbi:hypothetical protein [Streptomyces sp. NPDC057426]